MKNKFTGNFIGKLLHKFKEFQAIKNFFFLALLQGSNFLIFLILYPYLSIKLGVSNFGLVILAQSLMSFFLILADYGFNLQSTQKIAVCKDDKTAIALVHSKTIYTKILLLVIGFALLYLIVIIVPTFREIQTLLLWSYLFVVGQTLIPIWFFQGIEKFQYISYINVAGKIISLLVIFLLVNEPTHYIWVNPILGIGNLMVALWGLSFINRKFDISWSVFNWNEIKTVLKEGWGIFFSSFSTNFYVNSNILILKIIVDDLLLVGYYGIADRIVGFMKQLVVIAAQSIYPTACKMADDKAKFKQFMRTILKVFIGITFSFCAFIFVLAEYIIFIFTKQYLPEAVALLRILCFTPLFIAINNPAYQALIIYNHQKAYTFVLVSASLICMILNSILCCFYGNFGTAWSVFITEIYVMVGLNAVLFWKYPTISFLINEEHSKKYEK